jgi:enoyl-CoA hydratase
VPEAELDARVDALCDRLLAGAQPAIRGTKAAINLELKRIVAAVLEPGLALEALSQQSPDHRARVAALRARQRGGGS